MENIDEVKELKKRLKKIKSLEDCNAFEAEQYLDQKSKNARKIREEVSSFNLKKEKIDYDIFFLENGLKTNVDLKEILLEKYG